MHAHLDYQLCRSQCKKPLNCVQELAAYISSCSKLERAASNKVLPLPRIAGPPNKTSSSANQAFEVCTQGYVHVPLLAKARSTTTPTSSSIATHHRDNSASAVLQGLIDLSVQWNDLGLMVLALATQQQRSQRGMASRTPTSSLPKSCSRVSRGVCILTLMAR